MPIQVFYSNRIERLYDQLKQHLFSETCPFEKRLIIVPTPAIKSWLLLQLASDKKFGIAAGLDILHLNEALQKLQTTASQNKINTHYPSKLELALSIEGQIHEIGSQWLNLNTSQRKCWEPLFNYLKIPLSSSHSLKLSRRSERRLVSIANSLAQLFLDYNKYGHKMLNTWKDPNESWQQSLWQSLFSSNEWSYPVRDYESLQINSNYLINTKVHLFTMSFIAKSEHDLIDRISAHVPVHYYMLSPCRLFWGDTLSDKESKKLQQYWKRKNISRQEQTVLEDYLQDSNALLSNWGKLGRKMTELLDNDSYEVFLDHVLPANFQSIEGYNDFLDPLISCNESRSPTILEKVQGDILFMRNPRQEPKIPIDKDFSIQLHRAPSKFREIQILYQNLLHAIKLDGSIEPSDIIVMAPNIMDYAPYIRQVFGNSHSQFDYQLMDMQAIADDSLTQQFWHLIQLPLGRWDSVDLLELLSYPSFQKKHLLTTEDIAKIQQWIQSTGISWGQDFSHRNDILHQRYCQNLSENSNQGTWEEGFSKLLNGLVMYASEANSSIPVESSMSDLLGKFIYIIRSLKQDLKILSDGSQKTYQDWILELKKIISIYLVDSLDDDNCEKLVQQIETIGSAARWIPNHKISFVSMHQQLENALNERQSNYRENHLQAVKFCSMLPMRAIPSKIICIIGLDEDNFPRADQHHSLNLMKNQSLCDYCPSRTDFDRYLFLETLLSVRQQLILSYPGYARSDGKEQPPSLLITELLYYLDEAFQAENQKPSEMIFFIHPYLSYDAKYFSPNPKIKNYSTDDFQLAKSFYKIEKKPFHQFIDDFKPIAEIPVNHSEIILDIQQIRVALHNPFKVFFNENLKMYIQDVDELKTEESFIMNALQLYDLKKASLKQDIPSTLKHAELQGQLPLGLFKETAKISIRNSIEDLHEKLQKMHVQKDSLFEIELHDQYQSPIMEDKHWKFPPIEIDVENNKKIKIVGKIPEASLEGLIAHIRGNKEDVIKAWGDFVILNHLIDIHRLPIQKQLLCAKSGMIKTFSFNSQKTLQEILSYYLYAKQNISPLNAEWINDVLSHTEATTLEKSLIKNLTNPNKPIYNTYIKYVCRNDCLNSSSIQEHWQEIAKNLFSHLLQEKGASHDEF